MILLLTFKYLCWWAQPGVTEPTLYVCALESSSYYHVRISATQRRDFDDGVTYTDAEGNNYAQVGYLMAVQTPVIS